MTRESVICTQHAWVGTVVNLFEMVTREFMLCLSSLSLSLETPYQDILLSVLLFTRLNCVGTYNICWVITKYCVLHFIADVSVTATYIITSI